MARGRFIGVLEVLNKRSGADFTGDDLDLLGAFAAQAAVAIENARFFSDLREERDRLVDAEEMVRRKLQEELHDGLAQVLSSAAMKTSAISRGLLRDPAKGVMELAVLEDDLRAAVRTVRNVLFDLRPLVLETQGLAAAVDVFVTRVRPELGTQVHLDLAAYTDRLDRRAEVSIYGIIQEALTNILKHAQAQNVWITLASEPEAVRLTIRDDGRGFDVSAVGERYDQRGSFGLLNMQERARYVGGDLQINSVPGTGTTVVLTLKREAEAKPAAG
jgi:signal transduction histidine kinase